MTTETQGQVEVDSEFDSQLADYLAGMKGEEAPAPKDDDQQKEAAKPAATEQKTVTDEDLLNPKPAEKQPLSIEEQAKALGWNPDRAAVEAKGGDWQSAKSFLRIREQAAHIAAQSKEIKQMRRDMERRLKHVETHAVKTEQSTRAEKLAAVDAGLQQAFVDQDFDRHTELLKQRDELLKGEQAKAEDKPKDDGEAADDWPYIEDKSEVTAYVADWKAKNQWFVKTAPKYREEAEKIEQDYCDKYPNASVKDSLEHVRAVMFERYPTFAAYGKPLQTPAANPRNAVRPPAKELDASSLSPADRKVYDSLINAGGLATDAAKKAFFKQMQES